MRSTKKGAETCNVGIATVTATGPLTAEVRTISGGLVTIGPNHVQNFCFAPVHADTKTGELIYTNSYYYIGHFSKFVHPGSNRIATSFKQECLRYSPTAPISIMQT